MEGHTYLYGYLLFEVECCWDARSIGSWHSAADLFTKLPDVTARRLQIFEHHREVSLFLSHMEERPQAAHLYSHAVQSTLGKLHTSSRRPLIS